MDVQRTDLDSGIRILTETMPEVRSVTLGVWVGVGSRDEPNEIAGVTHWLEHLLFKGTATRSARDIAVTFDQVGGELNAFTAKEFTCFYARTLDADASMAIELVADMLQHSIIRDEDVISERQVVLEEISMHEDQPDDIIHDVFLETLWGAHPLGRRVLGSTETIQAMTRDQIDAYYRLHYRPGNLVIAAAGSLQHDAIVQAVEKAFRDAPPSPQRGVRAGEQAPGVRPGFISVPRKTEQAHIVYGTGGIARNDDRRWALGVLNIALGGGMSSRLFQEVREKRGWVYSIYSMHSAFADTGTFDIYAGTAPERARDVLEITRAELDSVIADGLTEEEIDRGKGHLKGNLVLGLEDTSGRMSRLGKGELCHGEILTPDEIVAKIDGVTADDVTSVATDLLGRQPWALAVIGPDLEENLADFVRPGV
ncbi:MAG: M16 family metallopeptidase [Actinomycetota bacterium]|nr:insulinase family protein [Actinomycetota bacterium]